MVSFSGWGKGGLAAVTVTLVSVVAVNTTTTTTTSATAVFFLFFFFYFFYLLFYIHTFNLNKLLNFFLLQLHVCCRWCEDVWVWCLSLTSSSTTVGDCMKQYLADEEYPD